MSVSFTPRSGLLMAAVFVLAGLGHGATITAKLERDGNGIAGPTQTSCPFCANRSPSVSVDFSGGFPPPSIPVVPSNVQAFSEIAGEAHVDLRTGVMRGRAHATSAGHFERHSMRFVGRLEELIDITVPAGLPASERVAKIIGEVHGNTAASGVAFGEVLYILEAGTRRFSAFTRGTQPWDVVDGEGHPSIHITPLVNGYRAVLEVPIPASGEIFIESQLEGTAWAEGRVGIGPGTADSHAMNTAFLTLVLPPGSTFTSSSGVFLTEPFQPAAVPEPGTVAMFGAGAAVLLLARLSRRRR